MSEPAEDEGDPLIGRLVDERYKILEPMASGSMGAVYKAERVPVGKVVAIKFLHAGFSQDTEFQARFDRETRVMSKLAHPNCVSVVDFGVWENAPYLVMEFVPGTTLRQIIDDGPLPPARALALARQITAGLAHAHAQGIVHRDIKPANIMISDEIGTGEHVRILDFGLARLRGAVGRDATQTNIVVGTPNYMAPEQTVGGGTIDARTDIYAVGVVLYEMIVGERPFQAEDTLALLGMHRAAPIPKITDRVGDRVALPDGLQAVVEKAMAKAPDDRYQSAIEFADAIDLLIGPRIGDSRPIAVARRSGAEAMAPTLQFDVSSEIVDDTAIEPPSKRRARFKDERPVKVVKKTSGGMFALLGVMLLLGTGAYGAYYVLKKRHATSSAPTAAGSGSAASPGSASPGSASAGSAVAAITPDAMEQAGSATPVTPGSDVAIDAAEPTPVTTLDAGEIIEPVGPGSGEPGAGSAVEPGAGAGSAADEIEMAPDPVAAEDLAPKKGDGPDDEADDAPKTTADVEKKAPPPPTKATTIHDAVMLIKSGQDELALSSLRALWKKNPKSAYVPFLLANLYFDKRWWSVALDHYRIAINKNAAYKRNPVLVRNTIRMLASGKTNRRAELFLRGVIGPQIARPYLKVAATYDKSPAVKAQAGRLYRAMGGR
ncbi:MAG TPA: protein kinase [Kofleriaceae bacterium]|nr:protein kinase [Kofleriaceae bacterium]